MIELKNFSKSYGDKVIYKNFNLKMNKGELTALVGDSGKGKTTLLKCIARVERFDSGELITKGRIGYLFQDSRLCNWLSYRQNIYLPLRLQGKKITEEMDNYLLELAKKFKVLDHIDKRLSKVSGGQKQRLLLIRALATKPEILLLDEPFKSLDDKLTESILKDIVSYCKEKKITLVLVSHKLDNSSAFDRYLNINLFNLISR